MTETGEKEEGEIHDISIDSESFRAELQASPDNLNSTLVSRESIRGDENDEELVVSPQEVQGSQDDGGREQRREGDEQMETDAITNRYEDEQELYRSQEILNVSKSSSRLGGQRRRRGGAREERHMLQEETLGRRC